MEPHRDMIVVVFLALGNLLHGAQSLHHVAVPGTNFGCSDNVAAVTTAAAAAAAASRLPVGLPLRSRRVSVGVEVVDPVAEDMTVAVPQASFRTFPDCSLLPRVVATDSMDSMCESASAQPIDCALGGQLTGILGVLYCHVSALLYACIDHPQMRAYLRSQQAEAVAAAVSVEERLAAL